MMIYIVEIDWIAVISLDEPTCYGEELAEAKRANKDSFFFTNITPQMDDFNQSVKDGLWGRLEDAVFQETDVEDLRVNMFGGPVFREDDRQFRGVRLPREFWKVIVFVEGNKLKAKGFLLTQNLNVRESSGTRRVQRYIKLG